MYQPHPVSVTTLCWAAILMNDLLYQVHTPLLIVKLLGKPVLALISIIILEFLNTSQWSPVFRMIQPNNITALKNFTQLVIVYHLLKKLYPHFGSFLKGSIDLYHFLLALIFRWVIFVKGPRVCLCREAGMQIRNLILEITIGRYYKYDIIGVDAPFAHHLVSKIRHNLEDSCITSELNKLKLKVFLFYGCLDILWCQILVAGQMKELERLAKLYTLRFLLFKGL